MPASESLPGEGLKALHSNQWRSLEQAQEGSSIGASVRSVATNEVPSTLKIYPDSVRYHALKPWESQ
jgi:hypothetical protein